MNKIFPPTLNMFHQSSNVFDFESTQTPKPKDFHYLIDLLMKKDIEKIVNKTSDPTRAREAVIDYVGIQLRHQTELGRMWFMRFLLRKNIFPQKVKEQTDTTLLV